jgi:hypothetical protein
MAQYADIVEIVAPAQATSGELVNITVRIKNLSSSTISIMVGGALEYGVSPWPDIEFLANWVDTPGGWVAEFAGHFAMPDKGVTVHAYSYWYGADGSWHFDDEMTKVIKLAELVPAISNFTITDYAKV